jgi:hypothetical protein
MRSSIDLDQPLFLQSAKGGEGPGAERPKGVGPSGSSWPRERLFLVPLSRSLLCHRVPHRSWGTLHFPEASPDAQWALPEQDLEPLDAIFRSMRPTGPEDRHRWLFNPNPRFLRPNLSWQETQAELEMLQSAAAEKLLGALSPEGLVDFARTVNNHHALGQAVMGVGEHDEAKRRIKIGLLADDDAAADLATGMLFALADARGYAPIDCWWERAIAEGWSERAELRIVGVLPVSPTTWDRIAARSPRSIRTTGQK